MDDRKPYIQRLKDQIKELELKLKNKYPIIQEGDKIKFVYLKEPNAFLSSSISFITKFPKEFSGKFTIDAQKQFNKSFIEPLAFITDKLKWDIKNDKVGTLEDFF